MEGLELKSLVVMSLPSDADSTLLTSDLTSLFRQSHCVALSLELAAPISLPVSPKCWDLRCVKTSLSRYDFFFFLLRQGFSL